MSEDKIKEKLLEETEEIKDNLNPIGDRNMRDMKRESALGILEARLQQHEETKKAERERFEKAVEELKKEINEFEWGDYTNSIRKWNVIIIDKIFGTFTNQSQGIRDKIKVAPYSASLSQNGAPDTRNKLNQELKND